MARTRVAAPVGRADSEWSSGRTSRIDVRATRIGKMLPVWVRYAYEGILSAGYDEEDVGDPADGPLERLRDMLYLLRADDPYFEMCLDAAQAPADVVRGGLRDLVDRVSARSALDSGAAMGVEELALLAGMNERSVRNAMGSGGDLKAGSDGRVDNEEARRWLQGRRGFTPTQQRRFPQDKLEQPEALDAEEIPPFVKLRLQTLWTPLDEQDHDWMAATGYPPYIVVASRECALSMDRLYAATRLPMEIRPQDCEELAKVLRVDRVWLTHQVMAGLFPDQVDMLLNPRAWTSVQEAAAASDTAAVVTVTLTDKMLAHGYIDLPMSAKSLFPDDCFGSRKEGDEGAQVVLVYGSHRADSDIRIKSAKTISPRRRFTAWLNTELGARPGDRIRFEKTGEREFTLSHLAG